MKSMFSQKNQEQAAKTFNNFIPENLNFGIWIWYSVEDRMLFSDGFCQMMDISKNVYPTQGFLIERIYPDDLNKFGSVLEAMLQGSQPRWLTFRFCRSDKSIRTIQCYLEVVSAEFAGIYDIIGVCFDVTEIYFH